MLDKNRKVLWTTATMYHIYEAKPMTYKVKGNNQTWANTASLTNRLSRVPFRRLREGDQFTIVATY